jgi:hypothetical protein
MAEFHANPGVDVVVVEQRPGRISLRPRFWVGAPMT